MCDEPRLILNTPTEQRDSLHHPHAHAGRGRLRRARGRRDVILAHPERVKVGDAAHALLSTAHKVAVYLFLHTLSPHARSTTLARASLEAQDQPSIAQCPGSVVSTRAGRQTQRTVRARHHSFSSCTHEHVPCRQLRGMPAVLPSAIFGSPLCSGTLHTHHPPDGTPDRRGSLVLRQRARSPKTSFQY